MQKLDVYGQSSVEIVEVGPRDGLQNLPWMIPIEKRIELINQLVTCGLTNIEIGSLVSSLKVPQMALSEQVYSQLQRTADSNYILLVASQSGMQRAIKCGAQSIALLCATSDSFSLRNIGRTIRQSLDEIALITEQAKALRIRVRTYISCAFGCPNQDQLEVQQLVEIARQLDGFGCDQLCLADTTGSAKTTQLEKTLSAIAKYVPLHKVSMHFHNSREQGLANLITALRCGVRSFDSSIGGLGGCPFTQGAVGNIATEDAVELFDDLGLKHDVDVAALKALGGRFKCYLEDMAKSSEIRVSLLS